MSDDIDGGSTRSSDSIELPGLLDIEKGSDLALLTNCIQTYSQENGINSVSSNLTNGYNGTAQPYLEICEQPQSKGFRFRYECEGHSHGGLQGESSERAKKTYPAVKICHYKGPAKIVVTLVTDEAVPKLHAHELVGRGCQNGMCVVDLKGDNMIATFPNLGIKHVTKKKVKEVLTQRMIESMKLQKTLQNNNNINAHFSVTGDVMKQTKKQAEEQAKNMQLNAVRLCFQAYLMDSNGTYTHMLNSVISNTIYDCKSSGGAALKICRMDKNAGCCTGRDEVFLLCEKVQKDDISVRFFEISEDGQVKWEGYGDFGPCDVHRQFAIVFRTPSYHNPHITNPVNVQVQLRRMSNGETSEPKPFTFYPEACDLEQVSRKRKKNIFGGLGGGSSGTGGFGGGGFGGFNYFQGGGGGNNGLGSGGGSPSQFSNFDNIQNLDLNNGLPPIETLMPIDIKPISVKPEDNIPTPDQNGIDLDLDLPSRLLIDHDLEIDAALDYFNSSDDEIIDHVDGTTNLPDQVETDSVPSDTSQYRQNVAKAPPKPQATIRPLQQGRLRGPVENEEQEAGAKSKDVVEEHHSLYTGLPSGRATASLAECPTQTTPNIAYQLANRTSNALQQYARTGDVKYLLAVQRHLVAVQDTQGDTAVHLAIIAKQADAIINLLRVVATLRNNGAAMVNMYNNLRQTPLHLAVITGQSEIVGELLKCGANASLVDRHGNTPAHLACQSGDDECLQALIKHKRPGTPQDLPFPELEVLNYQGFTPLHLAVIQGSLSCVKALVKVKVNVDQQDGKSGRTALHHAVETESLSIAGNLLLEANADVSATTFDGNTPLHLAAGRNLVGMAALLVAAGADPRAENIEKRKDPTKEEGEGDEDTEEEETLDEVDATQDVDSNTVDQDFVGHCSFDLAGENEKMLKVLQGVPYSTVSSIKSHSVGSETQKSTTTPACDPDHGFSSIIGDMEKMDPLTEAKLSKLLDQVNEGKDWRTLAEHLDLSILSNALALQPSPTKALFLNYEVSDGTIEKLRSSLDKMGRDDAVSILDSCLKLQPHPVQHVKKQHSLSVGKSSQESYIDTSRVESGIGSMSLNEESTDERVEIHV